MSKPAGSSEWHKKRVRAEKRFRLYGWCGLGAALFLLVLLLGIIFARGYEGFLQTQIRLPIIFDAAKLELAPGEEMRAVSSARYQRLVQESLKAQFPEVTDPRDLRALYSLISTGAGAALKRLADAEPAVFSTTREVWLVASSNADLYGKGKISDTTPEAQRKLSDMQLSWLHKLAADARIEKRFNVSFFTMGDSRTPELAGFLGAMTGSLLTLLVCLLVVFPLGVMTAMYLEEFAHKGKLVDLIEVNINNLAAVPSIVFGLLGLAVYINLMGLPRSASLVGGMTLALMILPVIIITTRAALKAIPDSIRDGARAMGATPLQVVLHHTLPLSMPGIMTGTILGMARAIGETAPLLLIGMVAFVADVPDSFTAPATVMPVQIYLWASSPEAGFGEKTATGILLLLVLLIAMNALAIYLRKKFEVRW
jgi:phosphate transport system permease protein